MPANNEDHSSVTPLSAHAKPSDGEAMWISGDILQKAPQIYRDKQVTPFPNENPHQQKGTALSLASAASTDETHGNFSMSNASSCYKAYWNYPLLSKPFRVVN